MQKDKEYYEYVHKFLTEEIRSNFKKSIDSKDLELMKVYTSKSLDSLKESVVKSTEQGEIISYVLEELTYAYFLGYALNCANKRYSLEQNYSPINTNNKESLINKFLNFITDAVIQLRRNL